MKRPECQVIFKCGLFEYEYERNWLKWPEDLYKHAITGIICRDNDIVISTRDRHYPIVFFTYDGKYLRSIGKGLNFKRTHGLSLANDATFWICDDQNSVIYNFDEDGNLLHQLGTKGYFSDSGYDPTVKWPHDLYTNVRAAEPFNRPTKLIQAPWGDYYCTDGYGNTAVHHFGSDLKHIKTWGGPGKEKGKFRLPHNIAVDSMERLWVCDRENFRIEIFDKDGNYLDEIDELLTPSELWCYDHKMNLCEGDGQISIFDEKLQRVGTIGYPGCFQRIHTIGGDGEGNLYLGRIEGDDTLIRLRRI